MNDRWPIVQLKDVCEFENGDRGKNYPGRKALVESGVPFINAGHLSKDGIDVKNMDFIPRDRFDLLNSGKVKQGDLLFCLRGSLGKFAIVETLNEGAIASSLVIVRPNEQLDNRFLAAYFDSDICRKMIEKFETGSSQPNLSVTTLKQFEIPLPPLPEQQRIAAILDKADALRAKRRAALTKLDTLLQATFLDMFGDPNESSPHGKRMKLGDIVLVQGGYAFKSKDYIPVGVKLVKIANVHAHHLTWKNVDYLPEHYLEEYSGYALREGDIVMSLTRPIIKSLKSVKVAEVREEDLPCLLNQRVGRLVIKEPTLCDRKFVLQFCYTSYFRNKIEKFSSTSLQPNVSTKQVEKIDLNLPSIDLQKKFSIVTEKIQHSRSRMYQSVIEFDNFFYALQQRAFKGEL